LRECLDSTFVSSVGQFVDRFEDELAAYTGAKHAVAVVNGTAALHIALKLAGVQRHDEVLMPALTFVATANAVSYCGATPHFVDSEERTLGIDCEKLRAYLGEKAEVRNDFCINKKTGQVIRAMVPMHVFGHPSDLNGLIAIARDYHLALVEDAAESLGSFYGGRHTGTYGLMGALSFNGNKTITTGGGGAIITNDSELARHAKHLTTTAKLPHRWRYEHDEVGYNYRMPNLNAALGCAQIERLPEVIERKRILYQRYQNEFDAIPSVKLVSEPEGSTSNYWLQTLMLGREMSGLLDRILQVTNDAGVQTRPVWTPMNKLKPFDACPSMDLETSSLLEKRILNLPSSVYELPTKI
jgi:aminotransferase in exopolysaccharide biosynthesis